MWNWCEYHVSEASSPPPLVKFVNTFCQWRQYLMELNCLRFAIHYKVSLMHHYRHIPKPHPLFRMPFWMKPISITLTTLHWNWVMKNAQTKWYCRTIVHGSLQPVNSLLQVIIRHEQLNKAQRADNTNYIVYLWVQGAPGWSDATMATIANDFTTVMDTKTLSNCFCVGQQDNWCFTPDSGWFSSFNFGEPAFQTSPKSCQFSLAVHVLLM